MSFKDSLKKLIIENTQHMIFMDDPIIADIDEDSIVGEISAASPQYGLKYLGYDEGILSFSTYKKTSVETFLLFLDSNEYVDSYAVSVVESDPFTKVAEVVDEIDFDNTRESEFLEFFIDVLINSNYVNYNDVYVDVDNMDDIPDDISFVYPNKQYISDFYDGDDDQNNDDSYGFDVLDQDETPLLVKLSAIKSANIDGSILVTAHPQNNNEILVQAVYKTLPTIDEVLIDLDKINSLDYTYDSLKLITEASYSPSVNGNIGKNDLSTTAAIYETVGSDNVVNIVENFIKDGNYKCDINLLAEVDRKIKVNFRGKKRIKMTCQPGYKYDPVRMVCTMITGSEKSKSRVAHKQMARTKKSLGSSYRTRILRKVRKAKRFRKMLGV